MAGRLVVVATPIGNLGDLSARAREELCGADAWVVEDTRTGGRLQSALGVKLPMRVLNDHSPQGRIEEIVGQIAQGSTLCLTTDAGTPVVSDPGAVLVDLCHERGLSVDSVPGASAVTTALSLSGFYAQRYAFLGFLPRKTGARKAVLGSFADSTLAVVIFESPHRVAACLEDCFRALGSRRYAICRELTKVHQQIWRSRLPKIPDPTEVPRKGEVTLVLEGLRKGPAPEDIEQV
ncbi:MAG: 16S rRNA (cytidine(1402)-2'-O)-methyltransferase [Fimbriimonadaceae bacterium]|nr:16S rRNA (cytidine(1402)-2'-O)-methyltransferase [Fimbriimonadaceae bacterium]QYK58110.1 MAG: 16S rRNA (cytidine(1402)-2'-O)-methyltransferase [Fimbriimonadaceae bacterium]